MTRSIRLSEAGIYDKWLQTNTFNLKEDSLKAPIFDYDDAKLPAFVGPQLVFGAIALIGLIALGLELMTERVLIAVAAYFLLTAFRARVSVQSSGLSEIVTTEQQLFKEKRKIIVERKRQSVCSHLSVVSI